METRAHHVLIGLFTLVLVGAILLFALWLGKAGGDRQYRYCDIVFEEAVSGLSKGSKVEFNGIAIGTVTNLRLDPQDPRRVLARVQVDSMTPLRSDTQARLVPAGITGLSIIRLSSGSDSDSTELPASSQAVPQIMALPSPMSKLLAEGGDIILSVNELITQVKRIMSDENVRSISRTLQHVEALSDTLAQQRTEVSLTLQQVTRATEQATLALAAANKVMGSTQRLIDGQGVQTLQGAQRSLAAFEKTMQSLEKLVTDNRSQLDSGARGLAEIGPAVVELRTTLSSLRAITRQLENRPADFLLGAETLREFKP